MPARGNKAVPLDGSSPLGTNIAEKLEQVWGEASYPGTWDDGAQTNLNISVELAAELACQEIGGLAHVSFPVRLTYGSDDGRITSHDTDAHVNATVASDDRVDQLQLVSSETMVCTGSGESFPYTRRDCGTLASVVVQLSLNHRERGYDGFSGDFLEVYEFSNPNAVGAADHVARLALEAAE